ncbi:MAG: DnaA N-terminal domain-containing protein, partial [Candidatus Omnitrophota bacterium]|nr:DnaA N-terminal domain-containing protein [Candidatus Omnitrophota bacterium]
MAEITQCWEETQGDLKSKLGETIFATWIAPLKFSVNDNQSISLEAPDQFFKDWVEKHYFTLIQET